MAILSICKYGADVLTLKAEVVTSWDEELERLVRDMEQTMHAANGVGLAANQVGIARQLAIIDLQPGSARSELFVLTNPGIVESSGSVKEEEGCLSLPGLTAIVERPEKVVVRYLDLRGEEQFIEGQGLLARALCHELDHLDGTLFPQRIVGMRGDLVRRRAKRMLKEGEFEDSLP